MEILPIVESGHYIFSSGSSLTTTTLPNKFTSTSSFPAVEDQVLERRDSELLTLPRQRPPYSQNDLT